MIHDQVGQQQENKQTKQENKHTKIKEHSPKKQQKCKAVMGKQVAKIKKNMM